MLAADTHTMPFHYAHPVTGENVPSKEDMWAPTIQEIGVKVNGKH